MASAARYVCVVSVIVHLGSGIPLAWTSVGNFRGTVQAFGQRQVEVFAGIPYAKPPLKSNRFRPPEKPKRSPLVSRFNPFSVSKYPAACVQQPSAGTSEDCLYLSVWRKQGTIAINRKPVVVIIHDGGFHKGDAHNQWQGNALAAFGDVIVVGFNYRLGVFGFLDLEVHGAEGFVGLEDQQLALEWIHDHISAFGGNRHNIILLGTEAGASSAIYHINRNPSRFQGAILDLLWLQPDEKTTVLDRGLEISKSLNCSGESREEIAFCLRSQSVDILAEIGQFFYPNISADVKFDNIPILMGIAEPGVHGNRNVTLPSVCKTLRWAQNVTEMGSSVNLYYWKNDSSALLHLIGSELIATSENTATAQRSEFPAATLKLIEVVSSFARDHSISAFGTIPWPAVNDGQNVLVIDGSTAAFEKVVPFLHECK